MANVYMKLKNISLTALIAFSTFTIASCNKNELINLVYGSTYDSLKEIDYTALSTMVNDGDSFILALTSLDSLLVKVSFKSISL